jgi:hypothetical protein
MMSNSYINTADVVVPINNNLQNFKQTSKTNTNQNFAKMQQFLSYQPYNFNNGSNFSIQQNQSELNHLVSSMSSPVSDIKMELQDKPLWNQFHSLTNEMILTKAGRRTFPVIKLRFAGLEETSLYTILVEFRISDNYKYRFVNGEWRTTPRNDSVKNTPPAVLYVHPDSPNFGHHWTKDNTAFSKLKLTNNENNKKNDSVFLKSLHKYDPVIHVYKHDKKNVDDKQLVFTKFFKETEFIAVTAYQNENVTSLKIKHNPFAKAFQNNQKECTIDSNALSQINQTNIKQGVKRSSESSALVKNEYELQEASSSKRQSSELQQPFVLPSPPNPSQNDLVPNPLQLTVKNIYSNQDLIQNWYNNYYPLPTHQYHQQISMTATKPPLNNYSNQSYDSFNCPTNAYFYNNQNLGNDYHSLSYQNNQFNSFQSHQHQPLYNTNVSSYQQDSQQLFNNQHQHHSSYDYSLLNDTNELADRRKQSSPIYEMYSDAKSNIVKRSSMLKDNRMAPYSTTRPSIAIKRNQSTNISTDSLSVSPVYNANGSSNQHNNHESDDSLNLTETNFLSPIQNQANNSASFTSTASSS